MQPIVNDFFCGCGGMGVGFLNAGYKIAGAWDFDNMRCKATTTTSGTM